MQSSKDLLSEIYSKIKAKGEIDDEFVNYLESIYPNKSSEILQALKRGVTKYIFKPSNRIMWTAIGENDEYLIYPKIYCSCIDFYKRVVVKRKKVVCKHLIAQTLSDALNNFKEKELDDMNFTAFIKELKLNE
ncbi:MAG: hypothetical protein ACFFDK_03155 [Promethearchaeota archaeon]